MTDHEQPAAGVALKPAQVYVEVSGLTGTGKSAVMGEIEIALKALGLTVEHDASFRAEKNATHADWQTALELYKPTVVLSERNVSRAPTDAGGAVEAWGWMFTDDDGLEWSDQHPRESGQNQYAEDIRPATMIECFGGLMGAIDEPCPAPAPEQPSRAAEAAAAKSDSEARRLWEQRVSAAKDELVKRVRAALSAPQPQLPGDLAADFTRSLPGGKMDDSTFEQIEDALDRANVPCTDRQAWLTLTERVNALVSERDEAVGLLGRIVEIEDGPGMGVVGWSEAIDAAAAFLDRLKEGR